MFAELGARGYRLARQIVIGGDRRHRRAGGCRHAGYAGSGAGRDPDRALPSWPLSSPGRDTGCTGSRRTSAREQLMGTCSQGAQARREVAASRANSSCSAEKKGPAWLPESRLPCEPWCHGVWGERPAEPSRRNAGPGATSHRVPGTPRPTGGTGKAHGRGFWSQESLPGSEAIAGAGSARAGQIGGACGVKPGVDRCEDQEGGGCCQHEGRQPLPRVSEQPVLRVISLTFRLSESLRSSHLGYCTMRAMMKVSI